MLLVAGYFPSYPVRRICLTVWNNISELQIRDPTLAVDSVCDSQGRCHAMVNPSRGEGVVTQAEKTEQSDLSKEFEECRYH